MSQHFDLRVPVALEVGEALIADDTLRPSRFC
jgi:hypothetical protein